MTSDKEKNDVNVLIEVSEDQIEVYLTLIPLKESPEFSTNLIKKALSDRGIIHGIKEDVCALLEENMEYNKKMLIASGMRPTDGKDGTIHYFFESNKEVTVKKGEKIGEIIHPEKGVDGMTVLGKKIPAPETKKAEIPDLVNVEFSPENKYLLVAQIDGYLLIDQSTVQVTSFFKLEISADEYEAFIKVKKPINEGDLSVEDLRRFLNDSGIVHGILEKEIEDIYKHEKFDQPVLAAQGEKVINGKDGKIKYYFYTKIKPQKDEWGIVNFKELHLIQNVNEGDKLAEIILSEQGVEGCTVLGKKISPEKGVQPILPTGKNTKPNPNNPNVLLANIKGSVNLKGTKVEVEPVITVKGNVDYSTGNIDFNGSVIVNGDVKSGFKIKATEDVQINGVVEDAIIEAGGNVLLKMGFIGRGKGQIIAQGDVTAKFCENENIISEGNIHINEFVMHGKIQTKGKLFIIDKKGLILGGETYAVKGIEAKTVGNENYITTAFFVGVDKDVNDKLMILKAHLAKNIEDITNIEKVLHKILLRKLIKKEMPEDKKNLLNKLKQIKDDKEEEKKKFIVEIKNLESKTDEFKKAVVKIIGVVYPGTSITIYDEHLTINEPIKSVFFKYTEEGVIAENL